MSAASEPYIDGDARAWFIDGTPLDVIADPTGRTPSIRLAVHDRPMTPASARELAAALIAAADYCDAPANLSRLSLSSDLSGGV